MKENTFLLTREHISNIINDKSFQKMIADLYWRWNDEKEYENISDYAIPVESKISNITKFDFTESIKMTKRPFGFMFISNYSCPTTKGVTVTFKAEIRIFISSNSLNWKVKPLEEIKKA